MPETGATTLLLPRTGGATPGGIALGGVSVVVVGGVVPGVTGAIARTRWLKESAIRSVVPEAATARGCDSCAVSGSPPSPERPSVPVPAIVEMLPSAPTRRIRSLVGVGDRRSSRRRARRRPRARSGSPASPGRRRRRSRRRRRAGDGRDRAVGADAADAVVAGVGDQVAAAGQRDDARGRVELGARSPGRRRRARSAPPPATEISLIPPGSTRAIRLLPVSAIRKPPSGSGADVAGRSDADRGRVVVAAEAGLAVAGDVRDDRGPAGRCRADAADAVVAGVGDQERAVGGELRRRAAG